MVRLPQILILCSCLAGLAVTRADIDLAASTMVSFESLNNESEFRASPEGTQSFDLATVEKFDPSIADSPPQPELPSGPTPGPEVFNLGVSLPDVSPPSSAAADPLPPPMEPALPATTPAPTSLEEASLLPQERERPQAAGKPLPIGPRTVTSTRTSTHVIPVTPTVAPEEITTIVIHTVHTLTVTPTPTVVPLQLHAIGNTISSFVTATETVIVPLSIAEPLAVQHELPFPSTVPILNGHDGPTPGEEPAQSVQPTNQPKAEDPFPIPSIYDVSTGAQPIPSATEAKSQQDSIIEANGGLRDSVTLKDLQKMFQDQLQKFREEFQPSQPSSSPSTAPEPSPTPDQMTPPSTEAEIALPGNSTPKVTFPQRKSGDMDFGSGAPVLQTELDRIISEVLPDVDVDTRNSVRKVLNSILRNDDSKPESLTLHEPPLFHQPQIPDVPDDPTSTQDKMLPWMRPSSSSTIIANSDDSGSVVTAGLTDKDQSQVEKYFSLLNLGRLKGLPEDAVHDLLDFLRADDKHQFVDDFRQRPFLKKIGLDVTSTPDIGNSLSAERTSTFLPDAAASEIDKDAAAITDFDALEQQVDEYLSEHPVDLERETESDSNDGQGHEDSTLDDGEMEIDGDEDDGQTVETTGVLRDSLRKVTKPHSDYRKKDLKSSKSKSTTTKTNMPEALDALKTPTEDDEADNNTLSDGARITSKFGKKPKLKKISAEGDEEEIERYDPEDDLFPTRKPTFKQAKSRKILSNNHNNEDERSKDHKQERKQKSNHLDDDTTNDSSIGTQSTNATVVKGFNATSGDTKSPRGSPGSSHDKFADIVKTTKPKDDGKNGKAGVSNSLEEYLEKVKKNPSSLFVKNGPALGKKSTSIGGLDNDDGLTDSNHGHKGLKKAGESDFFGFTSGAPGPSISLLLSSDVIATVIVILAICVILV